MRCITIIICFIALSLQAKELVYQDKEGIIRWTNNKERVAVFGANYCLPSACDYRADCSRGPVHFEDGSGIGGRSVRERHQSVRNPSGRWGVLCAAQDEEEPDSDHGGLRRREPAPESPDIDGNPLQMSHCFAEMAGQ